ncbi:hypothetical protein DFR58_10515 [Anaerobacterium chartisolvens]|uniref:Uncharacterized protein n=1 Tax=Anaerobacterium chartisolvens TaxID=1297424 RepID=A0A369BCT4_9FIRM|nr:hypothetical protein [Anaerobacterium chartisolvens]RCX18257.1 hypothetical protein DFR58_10515 [Anaerobacterium chartisolvens]
MDRKEFISRIKSSRGDIGIKQIAVTVAVIVVIGAAVTIITGNGGLLSKWINQIWDMFIDYIKNTVGGTGGS